MRAAGPSILFFLALTPFAWGRSEALGELLWDPLMSPISSAPTMLGAQHALASFEDKILPPRLFDESGFFPRIGGVTYRLAKTFFLDDVPDYLIFISQHEVFGHGARYREFGFTDNEYHLSLIYPYGDGGGLASLGVGTRPMGFHENLARITGGNEANTVLAETLRRRFIARGSLYYRETLLYIFAECNLPHYILKTYWGGGASNNDILMYLAALNPGWGIPENPPAFSLETLALSTLMDLANPFLYFGVIAYFYGYVFEGSPYWDLPMIDFGPVRYLPAFHLGLSPFGPEYYLTNYFHFPDMFLSVYFRYGHPALQTFLGGGASLENVALTSFLMLSGRIHVWYQPALRLGSPSGEVLGSEGLGVGGSLGARFFPLEKVGLVLELGYKSSGFVAGEPLAAGILLRAGLAFRGDAAAF